MKSRFGILLLMCVSGTGCAGADEGAAATRGAIEQQVDAVFAEYAKPGQPGCAIGIYQSGRTLYENGYGLASLEHGVAIDPRRTVFDIASVSKQFTAASVLLLAQDGKLALTDNIRKFVPEIPDYGREINVAHLIHHTSGLRDYTVLMPLAGWNTADYVNDADALSIIARQKALDFPPGSKFSYSNSGYFLLSLIVERVSGQRLGEFAKERIFDPLGMEHTLFLDDHQRVVANRATAYESGEEGFLVSMSDFTTTGDGAIQTTVGDLSKWQQNFDNPKVGGESFIAQMLLRGALEDGSELPYAAGLFVDEYRGLPTVEHDGGWAGYRSDLVRFPTERLSIATLCNNGDVEPDDLALKVADIYLRGKLSEPSKPLTNTPSPPPVAPSHAIPTDLAGSYWSREGGSVRRIEESDGKLWYVRNAGSRSELSPVGEGRLLMLGVPTRVQIEMLPSDGGPQKFSVEAEDEISVYERVPEFAQNTNSLDEFTGTYSSPELDNRWSFLIAGGKLAVKAPRQDLRVLEPAFKDAFIGDRMLLRFQRDSSGRIDSLLVDAGGLRDLGFEKVPMKSAVVLGRAD